mgnify:CR=1 FL=1
MNNTDRIVVWTVMSKLLKHYSLRHSWKYANRVGLWNIAKTMRISK